MLEVFGGWGGLFPLDKAAAASNLIYTFLSSTNFYIPALISRTIASPVFHTPLWHVEG